MIEITTGHVIAVVGSLSTCCIALWKVIDFYAKRDRERHDAVEAELKEVRQKFVESIEETANLKGQIVGQKYLSEKVLQHITELNQK